MMLDGMLQNVAGTDLRRHTEFLASADAYGERLRRFFEPLALDNAVKAERKCPECPGRLNFTRYDEVPAFEPNFDLRAGSQWALWTCLYLAVSLGVLSLLAHRRLREWPL